MDIVQIIKEYRESRGLSQRQFSQMCGISNTYVSYLEKGRGTNAKRERKARTQSANTKR